VIQTVSIDNVISINFDESMKMNSLTSDLFVITIINPNGQSVIFEVGNIWWVNPKTLNIQIINAQLTGN